MKVVFFGAQPSIIRYAYNDVILNPEIEYCEYSDSMHKGINKLLFTRRAASITPFFLQKILYSKCLNYDFLKTFNRDEEILFVFTCQFGLYTLTTTFFQHFVRFLKKSYPNSKNAFYFNDTIETCFPEFIETVKTEFDLVLTFDKNDAHKYGLVFYEEVYSKNEIDLSMTVSSSDVLFIGSDRGRFESIIKAFRILADCDLKAVFYLFDILPKNKGRFLELLPNAEMCGNKVNYKSSYIVCDEYCPYPKTLALINATKCMLEITLPNQAAPTLRTPEATVYRKKLLTNCKELLNREYYNSKNVFIFESVDSLSDFDLVSFVNSDFVNVSYDFSPLKMIDYIKSKLFKGDI